MMDTNQMTPENRRNFYRLPDSLEFGYIVVPAHQSATGMDDAALSRGLFVDEQAYLHFQLMRHLRQATDRQLDLLRKINRDIPEVAEYLSLMDDRFLDLSHHLFHAYDRPTELVDLSAGGLGFFTAEDLKPSTRLKVKLIFRPNFYGFICFAAVVTTRLLPTVNPEKPYRTSIQFLDISDQDGQALNRHIFQLQIKGRQSRFEDEP